MSSHYEVLSRYSAAIVLACYGALLILFTLNTLIVPSCGRHANLLIAGLHIVPLLFFLPSLLRHNVRSYVWLCFISLGYFLVVVPNALACSTVLNVLEPVLIVILFVAAMFYIRWRSRALKARLEQ